MDNRGNFTLEIVVVGIIILMILGVVALASEVSHEKISKSVEDNNIEKTISEIADIGIYIKLLEASNTLSAKALLDIVNILNMANELKEYLQARDEENDG